MGCTAKPHVQATLEDVRTEAEERYENLSQAYGELKLAWDNRGAREQDVEKINQLTQMIHEKDEQIQGFEKKYNDLRNVRPTVLEMHECYAMHSVSPCCFINCLARGRPSKDVPQCFTMQ